MNFKNQLLFLSLFSTFFVNAQEASQMKVYQNFDFVPGEKILFEDHFSEDADGEFPMHWKLLDGQGVINTADSSQVFAITKYYSVYEPRMKTKTYLPKEFTIELDIWLDAAYDSNNGVGIRFMDQGERVVTIETSNSQINAYFPDGKLSGDLPKDIGNENYFNKWHHLSIAVKDKQMKVYLDQYRVLVVPDFNAVISSVAVNGDASENMNMFFRDFKLAEGGGMNLLGKKFTDTKIVTHGITFDVNKAVIRPESMGTLNGIVKLMKENPELKFEVGGHTDSDGDDKDNMLLSEQRAKAVMDHLVSAGIAKERLSAKGYGESKPLNKNLDKEEKALNRRVEFIKI